LVPSEEHFGEALEGVIDVLRLEGTHFEEFEADLLSKRLSIACIDLLSAFQIGLVRDYNTCKGFSAILCLNLVIPRA
jgi:hypothetical protein